MRVLRAVALAVCCVITACSIDTEPPEEWRAAEPRLTGSSRWRPCKRTPPSAGRVVAQADCGKTDVIPMHCGDAIKNASMARRLLLTQKRCTDEAIDALIVIARSDRTALTDLAAAYVISAQRNDRPSDFVRALDALRGALPSPEARFNRALILEALGLRELAIEAWDAFLRDDHSDWSKEAREHRDALAAQLDGKTVWERHKKQIDEALAAGNRARIAELIRPFQSSAQDLLEKKLSEGRMNDASLLAVELAQFGPDKYPLDVVDAWRRRPGIENNAPIALRKTIDQAGIVSNSGTDDAFIRASELIAPVKREAQGRGYLHLEARTHASGSHFRLYQGRFREAILESNQALGLYERVGDEEKIADTHMARVGVYRRAGADEYAFREALTAFHSRDRFVRLERFHSLFGEASQTALALGYPHVALLYQQKALDVAKAMPSSKDKSRNLAAAYRGLAEVKFRLQEPTAENDLNEAMRLAGQEAPAARKILEARNASILGQRSVGRDAVTAFNKALDLTDPENHTIRAELFSRRSDARRNVGDIAGAKDDLFAAIGELDAEERRMLEGRKRGEAEEIWSPYFSRFHDVYRRLVRQLLAEHDLERAFYYTEKARAAEPLDLLQAPPPSLATRTELQRELPPGTFLVEYVFLDRETIAWLVSHNQFEAVRLRDVTRDEMKGVTKAVQRAARYGHEDDFTVLLGDAYPRLMAPVLRAMRERPQRMVIVPDGPMHGLPFAAMHTLTARRREYLIERATIELAGSGQLYLQSLGRDETLRASRNQSILLIGNPAFDRTLPEAVDLEPLPEAQAEIEDIGPLYPQRDPFSGAQATRARVLELAPFRAVVHIAAHSIAVADAPFRSVILLAKTPTDSGAMYAQDLVTRFDRGETRLVVLASCSSAGDLPVGPEGVAPLVRPLIGAGVPAVIGSLWRVKDATARQMSVSFHKRYRTGEDAATALQNVQIEWLRSNTAGKKPATAWSAFQVIGHSSSPFAPAPPAKEKPP